MSDRGIKNTILFNIKAHNKIASKYELIHGEIYNTIEQDRLKRALVKAISFIQTESTEKKALDYGCGSGNLTFHLASLYLNVIASDISEQFLRIISSRSYPTKVHTLLLNGFDLSSISDNSLDIVATYSVLHHIPDYLNILKEFMRVLKPGGVVYIDHESSDGFWSNDPLYKNFQDEINNSAKLDLSKFFVLTNYYEWLIRRFVNPRYHREGDIHVYKDDHIEWEKVISELKKSGGLLVYEEDYLLYKKHYDLDVYNRYKSTVTDMHYLVIKKEYY